MITAGEWTQEAGKQPVTLGALSLFTNKQELIRPHKTISPSLSGRWKRPHVETGKTQDTKRGTQIALEIVEKGLEFLGFFSLFVLFLFLRFFGGR